MSVRKVKTIAVRSGEWVLYWQRATELYLSMRHNLGAEQWNAAVIDAVQCLISTNDAYTVAKLGMRCSSEAHIDAVAIFEQAARGAEAQKMANRLGRVLAIKSHVEYGPSLVHAKEAQHVATDVERFYQWVKMQLV